MDAAKRRTLKKAAGVAAVSLSGALLSPSAFAKKSAVKGSGSQALNTKLSDAEIATISVHSRISAIRNDLEVVLSNTGAQSTRITQMTPSQITTARGSFDFSKLTEHGPLTLAPGQSVALPISAHRSDHNRMEGALMTTKSLSQSLREQVSVVTDYESFAMVDVITAAGARVG